MTPQLRFPQFTDDRQVKNLGDITNWSSGGTPPKDNPRYWGGNIPWISAASMYGKFFSSSDRTLTEEGAKNGSRIAKRGSILLLVRGSMLFNTIPVGIAGRDVAFNQDVKAITGNGINQDYLYYFFKASAHLLLSRVVGTGIGAGKLDTGQLQSMRVHLPQKLEQERIVEFLTAVDERIALMEKKLELLKKYKKGVMQKIFTQQIRFKDENGDSYPDWEVRKLSDAFDRVTNKNSENNQNVLTISAQRGLVSQTDYFNKIVAAKNVTNYYLLERNDFAYNRSYSVGFPTGAIKRLKYYDKGIVSTLYICFRAKDARDVDFFEHIFDLGLQNSEVEKVAQEGARNHGLLNIAVGDFFDIEFKIPADRSEQQKIMYLLNLLDEKINSEDKKLRKAKEFKKSLLQGMFV